MVGHRQDYPRLLPASFPLRGGKAASSKPAMKAIQGVKSFIALALVSLISMACATAGRKIDQDAVAKIKKGVTTKAEVQQLIGSPDQVTRDGDGNEKWSYTYTRAEIKGTTFIPIYGSFAGGTKTQNQSTVVSFGSDGVVSQIETSFGGMDVDSGLAAGGKANTPQTDAAKRAK